MRPLSYYVSSISPNKALKNRQQAGWTHLMVRLLARRYVNLRNLQMKLILSLILFFPAMVFATETYECNFTNFSDREGNKKEVMKITYIYDDKSKKAYVVGELGSNEVAHILNKMGGRSFVEITTTGNVMTTTITNSGDSVHSRNTIVFGNELIPSQFYGKCNIK